MEGRCIFVFFLIFNSFLGISGLLELAFGIILFALRGGTVGYNVSMLIIGAYVSTIFFLGACSWKKQGVLIAYFVLILLLIIVETTLIILIKVAFDNTPSRAKMRGLNLTAYEICMVVFGVSDGIAFLSFLCSAIYFCVMRKEEPQLYTQVNNMEYINMPPQYQNV